MESEEERAEGAQPERRLSRLAHALNNHLTPLLGFAELLVLELPAGSRHAGWALEIRQAALAAREVTEELLALGRHAASREAPASGDRLGQGTVLVVAPDASQRELARAMLELHGHRVVLAGEPGEAARLAAEGPVDLLLADLDGLGPEAAALHARLAAGRPGLPALFLCARPDEVPAPPGRLLPKPFTVQSLVLAVLEAMGRISPDPTP